MTKFHCAQTPSWHQHPCRCSNLLSYPTDVQWSLKINDTIFPFALFPLSLLQLRFLWVSFLYCFRFCLHYCLCWSECYWKIFRKFSYSSRKIGNAKYEKVEASGSCLLWENFPNIHYRLRRITSHYFLTVHQTTRWHNTVENLKIYKHKLSKIRVEILQYLLLKQLCITNH